MSDVGISFDCLGECDVGYGDPLDRWPEIPQDASVVRDWLRRNGCPVCGGAVENVYVFVDEDDDS